MSLPPFAALELASVAIFKLDARLGGVGAGDADVCLAFFAAFLEAWRCLAAPAPIGMRERGIQESAVKETAGQPVIATMY